MSPLPPRAGAAYLLRYLRDPYGSTLRAFDRVGDPHTVRALGHDLVVTGAPEHIRTILAAAPDDYVEAEVVAAVDALRPSLLLFPGLQRELGGIGPWARFQRRSRAVEALVRDELAARRRDATARDDILSRILASAHDEGRRLTDREVYETMMPLVVAGHETTVRWGPSPLHRGGVRALRDEAGARDLPDLGARAPARAAGRRRRRGPSTVIAA